MRRPCMNHTLIRRPHKLCSLLVPTSVEKARKGFLMAASLIGVTDVEKV